MSTPLAIHPGPADDVTVAAIERITDEQPHTPWPDVVTRALCARINTNAAHRIQAVDDLRALARDIRSGNPEIARRIDGGADALNRSSVVAPPAAFRVSLIEDSVTPVVRHWFSGITTEALQGIAADLVRCARLQVTYGDGR